MNRFAQPLIVFLISLPVSHVSAQMMPLGPASAPGLASPGYVATSYAPPRYTGSCCNPLMFEEARSKWLDNKLKAVKIRYAMQAEAFKGQTELVGLKTELMSSQQENHAARCEAALNARKEHAARQLALQEFAESHRKTVQVNVNLHERLRWPAALRTPALAEQRSELETALGGDTRFVSTGGATQIDEVERLTSDISMQLRKLHAERKISFDDWVQAKRYLEALKRAALETTPATIASDDRDDSSVRIARES